MSLVAQLGLDLDDPDTIDVGQEHFIRIMYADESQQTVSGMVLVHAHKEDPDIICQGFADVGPGEWEIVTRDPLTIHPSFVCNDCGDHGIVRDGKWHEAFFESATEKHQMPVWLRFAMMSFLESLEEIDHYYRRPNPDWHYQSLKDMVMAQEWGVVAEWLDEEYRAHITRRH